MNSNKKRFLAALISVVGSTVFCYVACKPELKSAIAVLAFLISAGTALAMGIASDNN